MISTGRKPSQLWLRVDSITILGRLSLSALPGEPVVLESHGVLIKPFSVVEDLSSGDLDVDDRAAICERGNISSLDLGAA